MKYNQFEKSKHTAVSEVLIEEKFLKKLNISDNVSDVLSISKKIPKVINALTIGGASSFIANTLLATTAFGVTIFAAPVLPVVLIGASIGASTLGLSILYENIPEKIRKKFLKSIPESLKINSKVKIDINPIVFLGINIILYFMDIALYASKVGTNFCNKKKDFLYRYFVEEWGFNYEFFVLVFNYIENNHKNSLPVDLKKELKRISSYANGVEYEELKKELISMTEKILFADDSISQEKIKFLEYIKSSL